MSLTTQRLAGSSIDIADLSKAGAAGVGGSAGLVTGAGSSEGSAVAAGAEDDGGALGLALVLASGSAPEVHPASAAVTRASASAANGADADVR
ncbi:hypothetical protein [Frigoribacterium sp. CFBP 13729]|uniref:hypothetical protein n=1 Tax=Frigoribacterium sp. CFBP 13729 TaxID=2775293 RepID=UPI001FCEC13D|nr:hypothetical protein [Frigoribacterium sp. CFBP 13729]